eukprot:c7917_g1_i1.p1 GENE.c7917_g1_i1~~c7917_g1_i1.p1  ORF type:complete len:407 (+),score=96.25 c7917_g1_i1:146-1222(+)
MDGVIRQLNQPLKDVVHGYSRIFSRIHGFDATLVELTLKHREEKGFQPLQVTLDELESARKAVIASAKAVTQECGELYQKNPSRPDSMHALERGLVRIKKLYAETMINPLEEMLEIQRALWRLPTIAVHCPTAVLIGSPNVGKSSLVRAISSGTPQVNNYPFTTRGVSVGHFYVQPHRAAEVQCQVMDTPGLLAQNTNTTPSTASTTESPPPSASAPDSPASLDADVRDLEGNVIISLAHRNLLEQLTIRSVELLPSIVIFVIDQAGHAGSLSTCEAQVQVRREMKQRFHDRIWVDVVTKCDMPVRDPWPESDKLTDAHYVSVATGLGLSELQQHVRNCILQLLDSPQFQSAQTQQEQ